MSTSGGHRWHQVADVAGVRVGLYSFPDKAEVGDEARVPNINDGGSHKVAVGRPSVQSDPVDDAVHVAMRPFCIGNHPGRVVYGKDESGHWGRRGGGEGVHDPSHELLAWVPDADHCNPV